MYNEWPLTSSYLGISEISTRPVDLVDGCSGRFQAKPAFGTSTWPILYVPCDDMGELYDVCDLPSCAYSD